jgi:protein required for attachment to host cells
MAASGKKKTTMAKLARESKLRERRQEKQARKDARKQAAPDPDWLGEALDTTEESAQSDTGQSALEPVVQPLAGA